MEHHGCIDTIERHHRHHGQRAAAALTSLWEAPAHVGAWIWYLLLAWQHRASTRHALAHMDDHQLDDVAISRDWADREAAKPFWRS